MTPKIIGIGGISCNIHRENYVLGVDGSPN